MLRSLKALEDYKVDASDGEIGRVSDFCFDDRHWGVRYLVVDTGGFWQGPSWVLVSPDAFGFVDWATRRFPVGITREAIEESPMLPSEASASRRRERDLLKHHDWPRCLGYDGNWSEGSAPALLAARSRYSSGPGETAANPGLWRVQEVVGCTIQGSDEEIGHVQDFIVDDENWTIRYVVVNTRVWWAGKYVILSTRWIGQINGKDEKVFVNLPRETIRHSPEWAADQPVNRQYEARLFDYYGRPAYWHEADLHRIAEAPGAGAGRHPRSDRQNEGLRPSF